MGLVHAFRSVVVAFFKSHFYWRSFLNYSLCLIMAAHLAFLIIQKYYIFIVGILVYYLEIGLNFIFALIIRIYFVLTIKINLQLRFHLNYSSLLYFKFN